MKFEEIWKSENSLIIKILHENQQKDERPGTYMLRSETQRFQCSNYMLQILKLDEFA
jgi:hypothetical protein